jgi:hypothetical protein
LQAKGKDRHEHVAAARRESSFVGSLGVCRALSPEHEPRLEHVVSGQSTHFDSLEELLAFMGRVLTQQKERR